MRSEIATLQFLEQTGVPAPKVFDFAPEHTSNPIGVGYILMEKLPGKSLDWSTATSEQRKTVINQLADVFIELSQYPFDLLGSLDRPGNSRSFHIGGFARESLTDFTQSEMRIIGPCSSLGEYHKSSLQLILDMIIRERGLFAASNRCLSDPSVSRRLNPIRFTIIDTKQAEVLSQACR